MSDGQPRISIIIPTFNRADTLEAAIDSIYRQNVADFEVLVVDNGPSTDRTPELLTQYDERVTHITTSEQGCIVARNIGAEAANADLLLTIDDDVEFLDETTLERLTAVFDDSDVGIVGGIELPEPDYEPDGETPPSRVGTVEEDGHLDTSYEALVGHGRTELDHVRSAFMCIRGEAFEAVGGFDRTYDARGLGFRYETDLCLRIKASGYSIVVDPDLQIWHKGAARARGFDRGNDAEYHYFAGRNHAFFMNRFFWDGSVKTLLRDIILGSYRVPGVARICRRAIRHRDVRRLGYVFPAVAGKIRGFLKYHTED